MPARASGANRAAAMRAATRGPRRGAIENAASPGERIVSTRWNTGGMGDVPFRRGRHFPNEAPMVTWLLSLTALAAIDAPVREVTVYSDRARVVRAASLTANGVQTVELPLLLETVDTNTLRVEAQGAEV